MKYVYKKGTDIYLANDRPRTDIGPQGDHVTAYALFKEFIRGLESNDPTEIILRLATIIDEVNLRARIYLHHFSSQMDPEEIVSFEAQEKRTKSNIEAIFGKIHALNKKFITDVEIQAIVNSLPKENEELKERTKSALFNSNQSFFDEMVTEIANEYLQMRNKQIYASFPREGSIAPEKDESAMVKKALTIFRQIDLEISDIFNKVSEMDTPSEERFYVVKKSALQKIQLMDLIEAMLDVFWYPRIEEEKLISPTSQEWKKISKKYNKGALPRSNDLKILSFVTAEHINTMCDCFSSLNFIKEEATALFIKIVSDNWQLKPDETTLFLSNVKNFLEENVVLSKEMNKSFEDISTDYSYTLYSDSSFDINDLDTTFQNLLFERELEPLQSSPVKPPSFTPLLDNKKSLEKQGFPPLTQKQPEPLQEKETKKIQTKHKKNKKKKKK